MESTKRLNVLVTKTNPYTDQNPGTSGLRKKVTHFQQKNYIENFVQSIFDAHKTEDYDRKILVVGGDGRYYNDKAIQAIVKISAANGISKVIIAENGVMSTPAVSMLVRCQAPGECFGAIILTASHNPGGEHEDLGIKYNNNAGAPATENVTTKIFSCTKDIIEYKCLDFNGEFSLTEDSKFEIALRDDDVRDFVVTIESSTKLYCDTMKKLFDFTKLQTLFDRKDFKFAFDAMHGVSGPYAIEIFNKILGVDLSDLHNCDNLPDFGGLHPDPNLVYAKQLVKIMDINGKETDDSKVPDFGAACDGDADRNMILGKRFFISPSDSVAMIAANYALIPNLSSGIKGVARSMPTSGALDRVAKKMGLKCYETPTGWKFFGNLMDAGLINLCGEESFGTGSDHVREKDGLWAVLCWLSILAERNHDNNLGLIGVRDIALEHWKTYGRDYYCRFDYEGLSLEESKHVIAHLESNLGVNTERDYKSYVFEYEDPVDHSISKNQGWIFLFSNGSRIIFRVSGTSSIGATIRIYFEKHVSPTDPNANYEMDLLDCIKSGTNLVDIALDVSQINEVTGRTGPTVIT
jgi:phosphoglucomutase